MIYTYKNYLIKKYCKENKVQEFIHLIESFRIQKKTWKFLQPLKNKLLGLIKTAEKCLLISLEKEHLNIAKYLMNNGLYPVKLSEKKQLIFFQHIINMSEENQKDLLEFMIKNKIHSNFKILMEQSIINKKNMIVKILSDADIIMYLEYIHLAKKYQNQEAMHIFRGGDFYTDIERLIAFL